MTEKTETAIELPPAAPDPFDPARLRLGDDLAVGASVKKVLTHVPVKKPEKTWFVRTHPGDEYRLTTLVLELKEEREIYLVDQSLRDLLVAETTVSPRLLLTAVNTQGCLFLWPVKLPKPDGRTDPWTESMLTAVSRARTAWVRVQANMDLGAYDVHEASGALKNPDWPETSLRDMLALAFKGRYIDSQDHPVLRRLRGEV